MASKQSILNFSDFVSKDWTEDLDNIRREYDFYESFNAELYGETIDYQEIWGLLNEAEKKSRKSRKSVEEPDESIGEEPDEGEEVPTPKDKELRLAFATPDELEAYADKIRSGFRLKSTKNPVKGVKLLSTGDNNPKTAKGYQVPVANPLTGKKRLIKNAIVHLLPAGMSGCETCPFHTPECAAVCLDVAGNPGALAGKISGRAKRTFWLAYDKFGFLRKLADEIWKQSKEAESEGFNFAIRLNGTSDISYEHSKFQFTWTPPDRGRDKNTRWMAYGDEQVEEGMEPKTLFEHFPHIQFYDYTKSFERAINSRTQSGWPNNYHITYSYSERSSPEDVENVLRANGNVAMVFAFATKNPKGWWAGKSAPEGYKNEGPYLLPKWWVGPSGQKWPIISGDTHDLRFVDDKGVIVGLAAKGDAKYVMGIPKKQVFVVQPDDPHVAFEKENYDWRQEATTALVRRIDTSKKELSKDIEEFKTVFLQRTNREPTEEEIEDMVGRRFRGMGGQRRHADWIYNVARPEIEDIQTYFGQWVGVMIDKQKKYEAKRLISQYVSRMRQQDPKFGPGKISPEIMQDIEKKAGEYAKSLVVAGLKPAKRAFRSEKQFPPRSLGSAETPASSCAGGSCGGGDKFYDDAEDGVTTTQGTLLPRIPPKNFDDYRTGAEADFERRRPEFDSYHQERASARKAARSQERQATLRRTARERAEAERMRLADEESTRRGGPSERPMPKKRRSMLEHGNPYISDSLKAIFG